jgi:hypothetical protein
VIEVADVRTQGKRSAVAVARVGMAELAGLSVTRGIVMIIYSFSTERGHRPSGTAC